MSPKRCFYLDGCLWGCSTICGDNRYTFPIEERQRRVLGRCRAPNHEDDLWDELYARWLTEPGNERFSEFYERHVFGPGGSRCDTPPSEPRG